MRDPDRIDPFLEALGTLWKKFPDWRFGQLVMNLSRDENNEFPDTWEWEEDAWLERIAEFPDPVEVSAQMEARMAEVQALIGEGRLQEAMEALFGKQR